MATFTLYKLIPGTVAAANGSTTGTWQKIGDITLNHAPTCLGNESIIHDGHVYQPRMIEMETDAGGVFKSPTDKLYCVYVGPADKVSPPQAVFSVVKRT